MTEQTEFVTWFRQSSPYIHAHRGATFVIAIDGDTVAGDGCGDLIQDIALLNGLGIRLVIVHGARPQIDTLLAARGILPEVVDNLRVTDIDTLECVKQAVGAVRMDIEARLSMGLANTPGSHTRIRIDAGNFVTARPLGVIDGTDFGHTGEVRRVDSEGLRGRLDQGAVVLVSPIGYSPTGEIFNLFAADVAGEIAVALGADKLLFMTPHRIRAARSGRVSHLVPREVDALLARRRKLDPLQVRALRNAAAACRRGVRRVHLVESGVDGALLIELFTRDGVGTLVTAEPYEITRAARIDDVQGIIALLEPFEATGVLVPRPREVLEQDIGRFSVIERDGTIIACAALFPFRKERMAELAGIVVHPDYRAGGRGDMLLEHIERAAIDAGMTQLFVLTTRTAHWFRERGFNARPVEVLPRRRRRLYNWQRNSKVFVKSLAP